MPRTAPAPNIPAIPGMNPGILIKAGGELAGARVLVEAEAREEKKGRTARATRTTRRTGTKEPARVAKELTARAPIVARTFLVETPLMSLPVRFSPSRRLTCS